MSKLCGIKRIVASALTASLMLVPSVYAEEFVSTIDIDLENFKIVYKGKNGDLPTKPVNAVVVEGEQDPNGTNIISIDSVLTKKDGMYDGTIYLDEDMMPGVYKLFVDSENGGDSKRFIIIDENGSKEYLNELNRKTTLTDFQSYFSINSEQFGVFYSDYSESFSYASKIMFHLKPIGGYSSSSDVYSKFVESNAIYKVVNSNSIAQELENNKDILSIDYSKYVNLDNNAKSYMNELIKTSDYTTDEFSNIFEKNLIYADIKTSDKWTVMKTRVLKYASSIGLNISGTYNNLSNKDAVFQEMFKDTLGNYDSILTSFNRIVEACYLAEQNAGNGSPSGAGGGGGGGGSFVNTANKFETSQIDSETIFSDIAGHWGYEYIEKLIKKGGINGYEDGTFKPDTHITRAEFTKIIVNVFEIEGNTEVSYKDVDKNDWYSDCINKASSNSLIFGNDGMFYPNQTITRQDAVLIVHRLLKQKGLQMRYGADYIDSSEISVYAAEAVSEMSGIGVISGNEGKFLPKNFITRAEASKIISLACELV